MSTLHTERVPAAAVARQFVERWSPRSFTSDPVTDEEVASLFEAARWAPSCFNDQPWLFLYGRAAEDHARFAELLNEGNRAWAVKAPLLGIVFARKHFAQSGKPNRWGPYDSGAAAMSMALQARELGLDVHFMGGFDEERSYEVLGVPRDAYTAMAAFAVGHRGERDALPEPYREREEPNGRKPHEEVAVEGRLTT